MMGLNDQRWGRGRLRPRKFLVLVPAPKEEGFGGARGKVGEPLGPNDSGSQAAVLLIPEN
jgi:hypothetical protein